MSAAHTAEAEARIAAAIAAAEHVADPLAGLVERTATEPGAAFAPEMLERLGTLRTEDRPAYETLRARLKNAGCRVAELDLAIDRAQDKQGGRDPSQADILLQFAQEAALFHAPGKSAYADVMVNGHRETWPVRGESFRLWLADRFYRTTGGAPSQEALRSALTVIEARACFDAPERAVHVRVGGSEGKLYLDLGDATWRAVEIDASGWRIVAAPPVRFRRSGSMRPLPVPEPGGSIEALRWFLNVQSDVDFVLVVSWALAVLRDRGPYPVLVLSGEQGSAKSTFSATLRALLDPCIAPVRTLPREDRDLFIAAGNSHLLVYDNVSGLPAWISDTLCQLATGGGFAVRRLYTDQEEALFEAARPVILNGIEDFVTRPDLADRALFLRLEPIPEERRRPEADLKAALEAERPRILGVLLDAVAEGLRRLHGVRLPKLPRMADFALWAAACETALWPAGTFWAAYTSNRDEAIEGVIDADPVAAALCVLMAARTEWTGTATDLLGALAECAGERVAKAKSWPATPRGLSGRLRRAATFLRQVGVEIATEREGRMRTRIIRITSRATAPLPEDGMQSSAPSAASAPEAPPRPDNTIAVGRTRTDGVAADGPGPGPVPPKAATVHPGVPDSSTGDGADGADANPRHPPGSSAPGWSGRL